MALTFVEGRQYRDSEEIYDGVVVDYDVEGRPYAIEFLRVNEFVDTRGLVSGRPVKVSGSELITTRPIDASALSEWREGLGITRNELASFLNLEESLITAWETGIERISNPELLRLALEAVEGNVREKFFRQMFKIVSESLGEYSPTETSSAESSTVPAKARGA
jgi:DNA-binding transcriptional regulator YiaG